MAKIAKFWLTYLLLIERHAKVNGYLPTIELWTLGPKLLTMTLINKSKLHDVGQD